MRASITAPTLAPASTDSSLSSREKDLLLLIYVIVIVVSVLFPVSFFSTANLRAILNNLAVEGILAVGMMMLMVGGLFDLSVGAMLSLTGVVAGWLMVAGQWPVPWALAAAVMVAMLGGWINGTLVARVGVNALITTLATMGIFQGAAVIIAGPSISNLPIGFTQLAQTQLFGLQMPVWCLMLLAIVAHIALSRTRHLRQLYYVGSNRKAARLSGIRVERVETLAFLLSGLLAGIAGLAFASRVGASVSNAGLGAELRVITAVILGGASLKGGRGTIAGALAGVIFMALVSNVLIITRVSSYWQSIVVGIILVVAVALDSSRNLGDDR
jgi:ribose/xylose/arabinose/galactoside ABC-type transport system permease subunit